MGSTKALRGVVGNFLGTYVSRYSSIDGYWLFGFLVPHLTALQIDLLTPASNASSSPQVERAIELAYARFHDQLRKAKVDLKALRHARVTLSRADYVIPIEVNGLPSKAWPVHITVVAETRRGRRYVAERTVVVARHNPAVEMGSARASHASGV